MREPEGKKQTTLPGVSVHPIFYRLLLLQGRGRRTLKRESERKQNTMTTTHEESNYWDRGPQKVQFMDLELIPGIQGAWWEYTLDGKIFHHRIPCTFTPRGDLESPVHLLEYFWTIGGNRKTRRKPKTPEERPKPGTGLNRRTWYSEAVMATFSDSHLSRHCDTDAARRGTCPQCQNFSY
ncbi:hypothetical protein AMELA_G00043550 [Ameiurus melas]|uniref:Uncharacterized protein n=1 Tax=Ameiurus melas TaxID=219545 RepID=A0A7J6B4B5_AMEME|nr:hypothetical protein AMELA_G00043550 [Ameiurus melas]